MPLAANAQSVTLEPGLYTYSNIISLSGRELSADRGEYCVREGQNSKSLDELVSSLSGGGECTLENVSMGQTRGQADLTCTKTQLGMDMSGTLQAEFGPDFYKVNTNAVLGRFLPVQAKTDIRRKSACPESKLSPDSDNPI